MADPQQKVAEVKALARRLGFARCGVAAAGPSRQADHITRYLAEGMHGEMAWLAKRADERADVRRYVPDAKSVIVVALSYNVPLEPTPPGHGRIARYAVGDDYHDHLKKRLFKIADLCRDLGGEARPCVDTAPVLEREWAGRAGVGWQGKNGCTIDTTSGSYLLLGEVITSLDLPPDAPAVDRCGTCTRCLDACPTDALVEPRVLDARRCISYLTIEHRGEIDPALRRGIGDWLFGCDICQEVCPWNRKALPATDDAVRPRFPTGSLDPADVLAWEPEDYQRTLRRSAMKRVKLPVLKRNAQIVKDNHEAKGRATLILGHEHQ